MIGQIDSSMSAERSMVVPGPPPRADGHIRPWMRPAFEMRRIVPQGCEALSPSGASGLTVDEVEQLLLVLFGVERHEATSLVVIQDGGEHRTIERTCSCGHVVACSTLPDLLLRTRMHGRDVDARDTVLARSADHLRTFGVNIGHRLVLGMILERTPVGMDDRLAAVCSCGAFWLLDAEEMTRVVEDHIVRLGHSADEARRLKWVLHDIRRLWVAASVIFRGRADLAPGWSMPELNLAAPLPEPTPRPVTRTPSAVSFYRIDPYGRATELSSPQVTVGDLDRAANTAAHIRAQLEALDAAPPPARMTGGSATMRFSEGDGRRYLA